MQEIVNATWRKENELKDLKTELAALDRKIELSLKPVDEGEDTSEKKQENTHTNMDAFPVSERLNEYKDAMGDRLVIASIPKYESEKQPKGFRL